MTLIAGLLVSFAAWTGHVVLWVALLNRSHAYAWPRTLVDALTVVCGLGVVGGCLPVLQFSLSTLLPSAPLGYALPLPNELATGYAVACVGVAIVAVAHRAWREWQPERRGVVADHRVTPLPLGNLEPRQLLAPGAPRLLGTLPGNQVVAPELVEKVLAVPNLPATCEGLRIAHLSDLHMSGRIERAYYDAVVEATNRLQADVIALTGDIVERTAQLDWIDQSLSRLTARSEKLFVLGNHDKKAHPAEIRARLVAHGFHDLGSGPHRFHVAAGECLAAGNELPWFGPPSEISPAEDDQPEVFRLALLHTPDQFSWAVQHAFHLALAGHTHGGQIRFPPLGALVAPSKHGTRYAGGEFTAGGTVMHVSQGTASLAPVRWFCPPQVVLLTLRATGDAEG